MKTLHLSLIAGIGIVAISLIFLIYLSASNNQQVNPSSNTPQTNQITNTNASNLLPEGAQVDLTQNVSGSSCVTHISNQTMFSGYAGSLSCPVMPFSMSTKLVNYTGFYSKNDVINSDTVVGPDTYADNHMQEELDRSGNSRMMGNFVLEPGHNGTITYDAIVHLVKCAGSCPDGMKFPTVVNVTNISDFIHRQKDTMVHSHYGIEVSYKPVSESIRDNETITLEATIATSPDVPRGTYWIILEPGNCSGGPLILLTVSECEQQK